MIGSKISRSSSFLRNNVTDSRKLAAVVLDALGYSRCYTAVTVAKTLCFVDV